MVTTATKLARICRICREPEGDHATVGDSCPVRTNGQIVNFHATSRFQPQEEGMVWQPGDTYTKLDYKNLVVVGIVRRVTADYIDAIQLITDQDGVLVEVGPRTMRREQMVRMVPA
jgi:hypothetical protein